MQLIFISCLVDNPVLGCVEAVKPPGPFRPVQLIRIRGAVLLMARLSFPQESMIADVSDKRHPGGPLRVTWRPPCLSRHNNG